MNTLFRIPRIGKAALATVAGIGVAMACYWAAGSGLAPLPLACLAALGSAGASLLLLRSGGTQQNALAEKVAD